MVGRYILPHIPNTIAHTAVLRGNFHVAIVPRIKPIGQINDAGSKSQVTGSLENTNNETMPDKLRISATFPVLFDCMVKSPIFYKVGSRCI
jgi:hypothetical protein